MGIKDLDKFGRALRLRWLWYGWDQKERPWKNLLKHHDQTDRDLFFASTVVTIGNGKNTPFWEAAWLNGVTPKNLAPNLYSLARCKHRTVKKELTNLNWIRNLGDLHSQTLLDEFAMLYTALSDVVLTNEDDQIVWKWTPSGQYSAASAYSAQFKGATVPIPTKYLWTAKTEPKCRFFAWLELLQKVQTADNLAKQHYECNPLCSLCYCIQETTNHLLTQCNFTEAAWDALTATLPLPDHAKRINNTSIDAWLLSITAVGDRVTRRKLAGILFSFWWQIWKERNRRIFDQREQSFRQVAQLTKDYLQLHALSQHSEDQEEENT